jgi:hypothetical protein
MKARCSVITQREALAMPPKDMPILPASPGRDAKR